MCQALIAQEHVPTDAVLRSILAGAMYDHNLWHALVAECLIFGAQDMPRIPCMIDSLVCLLAPHRRAVDRTDRSALTPIEQAYFGSRDLRFGGGWHRPEHVGWNDVDDVAMLTGYLQSIQPASWPASALALLPDFTEDEQRAEELAYVRDWWPALVNLYETAHAARQVVVCEQP